MTFQIVRAALLALALLLPSLAAAGISLAPIMQHWHQARRQIDAMLMGSRPYDQAAVRASLQLYSKDALVAAMHVSGTSAAARDFAARFAQFAQDAKRAEAASGSPAVLRSYAQHLNGECEACHAIYNN